LASVVTAINTLVATGFSIAGVVAPATSIFLRSSLIPETPPL
jgi:hypothetical protein